MRDSTESDTYEIVPNDVVQALESHFGELCNDINFKMPTIQNVRLLGVCRTSHSDI